MANPSLKASTTSWADETDEEETHPQPPAKPASNPWQKGNPFGVTVQQKPEPQSREVNRSEFPEPKESRNETRPPRGFEPRDDNLDGQRGPRGGEPFPPPREHRERGGDYPPRDNYDRPPREGGYQREERPYGRGYGREGEGRNYGRGRGNYGRDENSFERREEGRREGFHREGREGGYERPHREPRPPREPVPFPENPPFTAYVGNLDYHTSEQDLAEFFAPESKVSNVRLVADKGGRAKGYGYVEFADLESLKNAVEKSGQTLLDRPLKIDVADAKPAEGERRPRPERSFGRPSYDSEPLTRGDFARQDQEAQKERPKLALKQRSPDAPKHPDAESAYQNAPKGVNPFGEAKPRDENAALKRIEEERKKREEDQQKKTNDSPRDKPEEHKDKPPAKPDFPREKREGGGGEYRRDRPPREGGERKEGRPGREGGRGRGSFNKSPGENQPFVRGSRAPGGDKPKRDDKGFSKVEKPSRERSDRPPREPETVKTITVKVESRNLFDALGEAEDN